MNILAISPHPDDAEFGCGGSLIKYARKNHNVFLLVLTDGSYGADPKIRKKEQEKAAQFIGIKELFWGGYKDTELICNRELIIKIDKVIEKIKPHIVYLNFWADIHQDHRAAAQASISATRYIKEVLFYEVPSTQHFEPDVFINIGDVLNDKLKLHNISEWLSYASKDHFHHSLVDLGLSKSEAVIFIYLINIFLGISAIMVSNDKAHEAILSFCSVFIIFLLLSILILVGRRHKSGWKIE